MDQFIATKLTSHCFEITYSMIQFLKTMISPHRPSGALARYRKARFKLSVRKCPSLEELPLYSTRNLNILSMILSFSYALLGLLQSLHNHPLLSSIGFKN
ncbi:hypothetical protein HI914_05884 [Erysiphe necator]|nr:hypothetical protein HI914_05884 [Erysiphe necator]